MTTATTIVYGTKWCGDCKRAIRVLNQHEWPYHYIDIEHDDAARNHVEMINQGNRSVPTIVFPDGTIMVEPPTMKLVEKLESLKA